MDREDLKHWLDEGLSLSEIGILVNRDRSTVGYWIRKFGLVSNGRDPHAPKGGLTRDQLEPLIESGSTLEEMAAELERSQDTVRYWMKKLGLKTRNGVGRRPNVRGKELAIVLKHCARHGRTEFVLRGQGEYRCKRCRSEAVQRRRRKVKLVLVEEAGGKCAICGYDRHPAALHFHHLDPVEKSFGLSRRGITRSIEKLRAEARKCVLLCSNCHAEVEAGATPLP